MFYSSTVTKLPLWKSSILNAVLIAIFAFSEEISHIFPMNVEPGVSLALVLVFGFRTFLPGLLIGSTIVALRMNVPALSGVGTIFSSVLETYLGYFLLLTYGKGKFRFRKPQHVLSFIVIAPLFSIFVGSSLKTVLLYLDEVISNDSIPMTWHTFYRESFLGVAVLTPLVHALLTKSLEIRHRLPEILILYPLIAAVFYFNPSGDSLHHFLGIALLVWAALRFGFQGVSAGLILIGIILETQEVKVELQWAMALAATIGYFLATVLVAFETASEKERQLSINMKHKKIIEEALAILDQSLHKSPFGFALVDREFRYIRINESMAALHGIAADDHLGKTILQMIPVMGKVLLPHIEKVFKTGDSLMNVSYEGYHPLMSNRSIAGLISYYPIRHPNTHEIFAVAISFHDITDQIRTANLLMENQQRLMFAQEAGKMGAFEWDLKTNKVFWTPELGNIYGLEEGEFGGYFENWLKWIHPEDVGKIRSEVYQVFRTGYELNHEYRIVTRTGETRWILARGKIVEDLQSKGLKLIGINIDLTEQKVIEQKLRLTEANLLHALSVRDEFVATASHELKTPLQSLKLQIQMFQRSLEKQDASIFTPAKLEAMLDKNNKQIDKLTRLVDDMLDISRIRTGKLTITKEPCEISSIIEDILNRMKSQFEASGSGQPQILKMDKATGQWDPLRVEQVITNILTNAIRYGDGKPISISVENLGAQVRLIVKDQGLGIPKSDQQKIFQRYERGILKREMSGLGLGLFITQQIVEAHGGIIWVESEINHGAAFCIELPTIAEFSDKTSFLTNPLVIKEEEKI